MRRVLVITTVLVLSVFISRAQITKGATWLGGSVGFYNRVNKEQSTVNSQYKQTSFSLNPAIGKAIRENVILGFNLSYQHSKEVFNDNQATREGSGYGAGILYRRYAHLGRNFYLFGQGTTNYGYGKTEEKNTNNAVRSIKGWNINASLHPGLSYALMRTLHLEAGFSNLLSAQYTHDRTEEKSTNANKIYKGNEFRLGASLENLSSLYLGVRFILP